MRLAIPCLVCLALAACTPDQSQVEALRQRQVAMEEQLSGMAGELDNLRAVIDSRTWDHVGDVTNMIPPAKVHRRRVRVTTYNATKEQCGPNPEITASGARSTPGWHAAVSRDLARSIPMGSRVHVPGHGWWEVQDKTAATDDKGRPIVNTVDLMLPMGAKHFTGEKVVEVVRK